MSPAPPSEATVRALLDRIPDPCSLSAGVPVGLERMGLVRAARVEEGPDGAVVRVVVGVTDPSCFMGATFAAEAEHVLADLPGVARVEVALDDRFDWSPQDMAADYREELAARRAQRRAALPVVPTGGGG